MTATETAFGAGVYDGMPEDVYHGDPVPDGSLSSSGARKLLPPGCPAKYRYERDHPEHKDVFDFGTAAHRQVLGKGFPIYSLNYPDWRTKPAQQARDEARRQGYIPLLAEECDRVNAMADAIKAHPLAGPLLTGGIAEQSYFWQDPEFGIWRRARLDSSRHGSGRLLVTDYKTTACAEPSAFAKSCANYGYHQQASWYLDAVAACLEQDAAFLFIAQEKTPPHLVTVAELDEAALRAGDALNRRAMEIFRDCQAADAWPGYQLGNDVALLSLPAWARPREDYEI